MEPSTSSYCYEQCEVENCDVPNGKKRVIMALLFELTKEKSSSRSSKEIANFWTKGKRTISDGVGQNLPGLMGGHIVDYVEESK